MVGTTRRAALVAAPALLLAACGGTDAPKQQDPNVDTGTEKQGDTDLLLDLRSAERRAVAQPGATPENAAARRVQRALRRQADDHVQAIEAAIRTLGGRVPAFAGAPAASGAYDPQLALTGTQRLYALYLDFVPKLADPRVRRLAAGILADHAAGLAQLRLLAQAPPVPEAFVT